MNDESDRQQLLEEAEEYLAMVKQELARREQKMVFMQQQIAALRKKEQELQPEKFLRAGEPMLIRSIAESRKHVLAEIESITKQIPELEKGILNARERLQMALQECEELRG